MSITSKELAGILHLSESAVSLALNNKPGVSTATRCRVIEAAREHGYDFSRLAPAEPFFVQGTIQFVIFKRNGAVVTDTPFFSQISEGISETCKKERYYMNIQYLYENDDVFSFLDNWKRTGIKGLILLGTEMKKQDIIPFVESHIPFILLDNYFDDFEINSVLINNRRGAFLAAEALIRKYRTQPGYLKSAYPINNFEERADGFFRAIRQRGMSPSRTIIHPLTPSMEGAYADMKQHLDPKEPLARCYFADNDLIAAGAIRAMKEAGIRIPENVAVIAFDDMPFCTVMEPALSTIRVPKYYMGEMAVQRLAELIRHPESEPVKIEINTSLVRRKSY